MTVSVYAQSNSETTKTPQFFYPGEPLKSDEIRISIMGSTSTPRKGQAGTSYFIQTGNGENFMFDCGTGVVANYISMGVAPSQMNNIFITHLHMDHIADIPYVYAFLPAYDRRTPLNIWGPTGKTEEFGTKAAMEGVKQFSKWHRTSFNTAIQIGDGYEMNITELDHTKNPGIAYDKNGVVISYFPAVHQTGSIAYKLEWNGMSVFIGTDGVPSNYTVEHGKNADVVIHEVSLPASIWAKKTGMTVQQAEEIQGAAHTTPLAFGYVMSKLNPRLAIAAHGKFDEMINQVTYDDIRLNYSGDVIFARDLQVYNISKQRITKRLAVVPEYGWPTTLKSYGKDDLPPIKLSKDEMMDDWLWKERIDPKEWTQTKNE